MIPRVIHFFWFGKEPTYQQLIGIRSALLNTTMKVILHTDIQNFSIPGVEIRPCKIPNIINGIHFEDEQNLPGYRGNGKRIAHVTDILRLQVLYDEGGIYSDMDVIWFRNPSEFFDKECVIGYNNKSYKVLINCVMMSEPKNEAIKVYLDWVTSIYPCKKYWIPANPYKIWKDRKDVTFAEKWMFCPLYINKRHDITWKHVERSICAHLSDSMEFQWKGEVIDYLDSEFKRLGWITTG